MISFDHPTLSGPKQGLSVDSLFLISFMLRKRQRSREGGRRKKKKNRNGINRLPFRSMSATLALVSSTSSLEPGPSRARYFPRDMLLLTTTARERFSNPGKCHNRNRVQSRDHYLFWTALVTIMSAASLHAALALAMGAMQNYVMLCDVRSW